MYAVVIGAGEVGSYVARILVAEGHDVAVVEVDEDLAGRLDATIDALVIHGSGIAPADLQRAGIAAADLLVAVTSTDEVNLVACMTARKQGRQGLRAIARVRQSQDSFGGLALSAEDLDLEALISPQRAISKAAHDALRYPGPGEMRELAEGKLALVGMALGPDSPLVHESLATLRKDFSEEFLVVAVKGAGGTRVPSGSDALGVRDRAFVLVPNDRLTELAILSGRAWHRAKKVLLVGCGNTGLILARALASQELDVTIIERDRERAEIVASRASEALVRRADGTDPELLASAIEHDGIDTVVVLLPEAEKSVLVGMLAKSLGAAKVIVRCDLAGYAELATRVGVDVVLSPKRAMADSVLEHMRWGSVSSAWMLGEHELEVLELTIPEQPARPEVVEEPLKNLEFPVGSLVGAVIRGDDVVIGSGETVLRPGDTVLVVCRPDVLPEVEALLS